MLPAVSEQGPWYILYDNEDKRRRWSADKLRHKVRERDVAGDELVRLEHEPDEALHPLFTEVLFQQVHKVGPQQAELVAHANHARGFLFHTAIFFAISTALGWPFWVVFWAMGLFGHFSKAFRSLAALKHDPQGKSALFGLPLHELAAPSPAQSTPTASPSSADPDPEPEPEPEELDPLASEAMREWKRIESVLERADPPTRAAVQQARASLDSLLARRKELAEHLDGEDDASLATERADLEADLAVDGLDALTREALSTSLEALDGRRTAAAEARAAADRARARARAFVHQLKALRLYLVSRGDAAVDSDEDLGKMVEGIQAQTRAAAELEEALVEARSAAAPARRTKAGA